MTATVATSPALASALSSDSESVADERNLFRRGQTAVTEDDDEEAYLSSTDDQQHLCDTEHEKIHVENTCSVSSIKTTGGYHVIKCIMRLYLQQCILMH